MKKKISRAKKPKAKPMSPKALKKLNGGRPSSCWVETYPGESPDEMEKARKHDRPFT